MAQIKIIVDKKLMDKAEQYNIFAPRGRNGLRTMAEYFEDCILRDIKERTERIKELKNR